jgi:DNA-binding transcriptional regulator LsrR (DeoR family)
VRHSLAMGARGAAERSPGRFPPQLMYAASALYYLEDATQAEIAERLGTSRATVSRLLSQARRSGIVRIDVVPPSDADDEELARRVAGALGLRGVHLGPTTQRTLVGVSLAPALARALSAVGLQAGDVLLVSSGRTVYEVAQGDLPALPGVLVAPMVGGQDEPEPWYQTNEITRLVAAKLGGRPVFLYAPALPGADLHARLLDDPSTHRVIELWQQARCAVVGVGAPPLLRSSLPAFVPTDSSLATAVGDVCNRYFDRAGGPVPFPGSEHLIAIGEAQLRALPDCIAVAVGQEKVPGIVAGSRAGLFTSLVTDAPTAAALLDAVADADAAPPGARAPAVRTPGRTAPRQEVTRARR